MAENQNLPTSVTLSDGRVATPRKAKVRDLAMAENQPKNKEFLVKYAQFAAKVFIDGKPCVLEDILDLDEDDFGLIASLFISDEDFEAAKND